MGYTTIKEMSKLELLKQELAAAHGQAWQHFLYCSTCKYFMFAFLASDASLYIYKNQFSSKQPSNIDNTRGLFIYFEKAYSYNLTVRVHFQCQQEMERTKTSVVVLKAQRRN